MNTNKQWLLVTFSDNWSDEMDLEGFEVVTRKEYDDYVAEKLKIESEEGETSFRRCFGTNEDNEYESFQDYLDQTVSIQEISDEEAEVLMKFFPGGNGFTPLY